MSRPRGQHAQLLPGLPRHYPACTARRRAEDGCECSISYYLDYEKPLPTARQWRARRRRASRSWREWDLIDKRHGMPPQHVERATSRRSVNWSPPPPCTPGCPAYGFDYARDWPPTVTSWKGLTRR